MGEWGSGRAERCWMKDHPHLNPPPSRGRRDGEGVRAEGGELRGILRRVAPQNDRVTSED